MGETMNAYKILLENLKGKDHFENLGVDGSNNIIKNLRQIG
jgi:hypothetical protein